MEQLLWMYINSELVTYNRWMAASLETMKNFQRKPVHSCTLQERAQVFISDWEDLPFNLYQTWNESALDKDENLA